jgi:hypothetical protein
VPARADLPNATSQPPGRALQKMRPERPRTQNQADLSEAQGLLFAKAR